ncbi:hypothetical protein HY639_03785 [Candidatus Woesearchaeota archaeon]|nr:hypothetical protein [Candidatus Woesearchaeota archaeon]
MKISEIVETYCDWNALRFVVPGDEKGYVTSCIEGIASLGSGAYVGFCHAQGISLDTTLEKALTYGPAIAQGAVQGTLGAVLFSHGPYGGSFFGVPLAAITGGVYTAVAAMETAIGYGIGYALGGLMR